MDFLGRVEFVMRDLARGYPPSAGTDAPDILRWCSSEMMAGLTKILRETAALSSMFPEALAARFQRQEMPRLSYVYLSTAATLQLNPESPSHQNPESLLSAARLFAEGPSDAARMLWNHWFLLQLPNSGEEKEKVLARLWQRAFARLSHDGHLYRLTPETLLDTFVYDELTALHAAYRSAVALRDAEKLAQCRRLVEYHVQNTQPDHTTAEPWALAAFAALDETHTFAEQQLHDATTAATAHENPVILALLADAVLAMRDARNWSA